MLLELLHPEISRRDCDHCQKFLYDESTGLPIKSRKKDGSYRQRDQSCPPPCRTSVGCKKGTPENSLALNPVNRAAWEHNRECRAVGVFPDDPLVRQNAAIIEDAIQRAERIDEDRFRLTLVKLVTATK